MTDKEIRLELAKAALIGGCELKKVCDLYTWICETNVNTKSYDDILVSDLEQAMGAHAKRFRNRCRDNGIRTVGQLLEMGSSSFRYLPFVGDGLVTSIRKALKLLYGIETW